MDQDRRILLKAGGLMGAAALTGAGVLPSPALAQAPRAVQDLPRRMTFVTLRREDGYGLGARTDRGILDVMAAAKDFQERLRAERAAGAPDALPSQMR